MRVGTIAWNCHSGLGHLARDFYRHGVVHKVIAIDHPHYDKPEKLFYSNQNVYPLHRHLEFLKNIDVLLLFETAVGSSWKIVKIAKNRGIKIVLIPMYEWSPFPPPVGIDLAICPSLLDVDYYNSFPHTFIPIPVEQQWRQRFSALEFVHNAGHGQRQFTKGTLKVIEAMQYVESPIRLKVNAQPGEKRTSELADFCSKFGDKVDLTVANLPDEELFASGDVFINAEEYNGLSLMLQEARAAGMLVITTNRYPTNTWLPVEPLIPVEHYVQDRIRVEFQRAIVTPKAIATKIDEWYGRGIADYSYSGYQWAQENSWDVLRPKYIRALESCL